LPAVKQLLLYLAMFGGSIVLIKYTVHATWNDNRQGDKGIRISDQIKVPVQFLHYLVILGGVSAPWPAFLSTAFTTAAVVFGAAGGQSSSLDC
jgi:formate hydrogenlyase subunit 3/multisubunit Na+/H+ antiporter MnhD subunit